MRPYFRKWPQKRFFSRADAQRRVLAEWRGVDLAPLVEGKKLRARTLGDILPGVMNRIGLERKRDEAQILQVWNQLIDPTITPHAQPTGLVRGTLFVSVDNNVWLNEIVRYRRHEILDRLQHGFGKSMIQRISFRVG